MWYAKLLLSGVLAVTAMTSATVVPTAEARDPRTGGQAAHDPHHRRYEVFYRHDHHDTWRLYGVYHSHSEAEHTASHLRGQGHLVRVHHHG